MKKIVSLLAVLGLVCVVGMSSSWASDAKGSGTKQVGSETKAGSETKVESSETKAGSEAKAESATKVTTDIPSSKISIVEIAVATGVEARLPVGVANTFNVGVEKLYCYTKITGAKEGDTIVHRWKKGELVMAEVKLNIGGSPWRTFSSKNIMQEWSGDWTIEILDGEQIIETKSFVIE